ncbi:MAG: dual specificity protein phosphatase family protein [Candidatus Dormibacteraeota bacterium]|uniref:Dual specificity protein phosphatase family protein n=1 Tax=Candidatus Amunia macphersoniae TaxID=3127014 RepID=A0A934KG79_9BACT|nr:dual specificity protein phosphatase family protein [Candidatus Dormibacteraeota bacterium]
MPDVPTGFIRPAGEPPALPTALAPRVFWVRAPVILAGAYPGDLSAEVRDAKFTAFRELGVTRVISLMKETELDHSGRPFDLYAPALEAWGMTVARYEIRDVTAASAAAVSAVLDDIDTALRRGAVVYVHCWGGRGRTGTIVGCWMIRHGWVAPHEAVAELSRLRSRCVDVAIPAPDTRDQVARVTGWSLGQ